MSNKKQIERLQFSYFRGATVPVTFHFKPRSPIVLIFGENGSGKSTIADALDFICNSNFGSLRLRKGTTPRTHIVSTLGKAEDLDVEMVYGGDTWRAKLQSGKPVTTPAQPPLAFILRRADITRIMEVTDGDRYKNLKEFITVPLIENAETPLRAVSKAVAEEVDHAIRQKDTAETTLQQFWEAEGKPNDSYLTWARSAVQQPVAALEQRISAYKSLKDKLEIAFRAEKALAEAEISLQQCHQELMAAEQELVDASQTQPNADLVSTLQSAQNYLHQHPEVGQCPVCSKPEPYHNLLTQIDDQLVQLRNIQSIHQKLEKKRNMIQSATGVRDIAQQEWLTASETLLGLLPEAPANFLATPPDVSGSLIYEDLRAAIPFLNQNKPVLETSIEQDERVVAQHNALNTHLITIDELQETMEAKHAVSQRLKSILAIVEEERKRYVQDTVDSISEEVDRLYARIHPDEPLGKPSFGMKPHTIGSLTMKGKFGNNANVPPVAYYSEAHLDTLGLCVYLALAKQSGNALVVLDDVLMSVDDPHLDRVIDLINDEAPNFGQVIITTHSRAWFDRVRLGQGMAAELIELYGWDFQNGINHSRAPLAVENLREAVYAKKLDRQMVASRAGILLEQLLDALTLRYGCKLARKQAARYTLGELVDGIDKKLRELLQVEKLDVDGKTKEVFEVFPLIQTATSDTWIRNQVGAHFNPDAAGIPDPLVRKFGINVLAFADAVLCDHCHQLPGKNKSGSYWECGAGCGKTRHYPLVKP